jgi:hypothetical protein
MTSGLPTGEDERTDDRRPTGRWWLVAPVVGIYVADVALTLSGQPAEYWAGDFATVNEINPVGHALLRLGPWPFLGATAAWLAALVLLTLYWRHRLAEVAVKVLTVGHAVGGACWVARHGGWWFVAAAGFLGVAAVLTLWCWQQKDGKP